MVDSQHEKIKDNLLPASFKGVTFFVCPEQIGPAGIERQDMGALPTEGTYAARQKGGDVTP